MAENPWLTIPIEDYEAHMALPGIGQARMLAEELTRATSTISARSVAVVGCSGGNGLEALPASVRRIVAIDINPAYVETVRGRFGGRSAVLEPFVADIQKGAPPGPPVDLVYAGLIFEYVEIAPTMTTLRALCAPGGRWSPSSSFPATAETLSPTPPSRACKRWEAVRERAAAGNSKSTRARRASVPRRLDTS
jgi:SAM-dependent methyltransferase